MNVSMRYFLLFLCICCGAVHSSGQATNTRFTFGYLANVATGVFDTDSVLYMKGIFVDTNFVNGTYWHTFNKNTNETHRTEYVLGPGIYTESWYPRIIPKPNGNFVTAGYAVDVNSPDTFYFSAFIVELSPKGDVVQQNIFKSPYVPLGKDFIVPSCLYHARNGDFLISGGIDSYQAAGGFLARFSPDLQLKWLKPFGAAPLYESMRGVIELSNGQILISGSEYNSAWGSNLVFRSYFVLLDSTGQQVLDEWRIPETWAVEGGGGFLGLAELPNKKIVGAGWIAKEEYVNDITNFVVTHPSTICLDTNGTVLWRNNMGDGRYTLAPHNLSHVVLSHDSTHLIAAGNFYEVNDTSPPLYSALIQKMTLEGDSVWQRLVYYPAIDNNKVRTQLFDMAPAYDQSGYWLCGSATYAQANAPQQQGWLAFVDNYGCLVPGCHLVNTSGEPLDLSDNILAYPNPATTQVSIYHGGHTFDKGRFSIVDMQGRTLQEWTAPTGEMTAVINLAQYPMGTYFVQYMEEGKVRCTKRVVKQ
jgi:hypothetical protein